MLPDAATCCAFLLLLLASMDSRVRGRRPVPLSCNKIMALIRGALDSWKAQVDKKILDAARRKEGARHFDGRWS